MELEQFMRAYWALVAAQDAEGLRAFFCTDARVRWHCTREEFSREEFIRANCEYPGQWQGEVERIEQLGGRVITAARVWSGETSFHVCSFFELENGKISRLDEYWGDDGPAPEWRCKLQIGKEF